MNHILKNIIKWVFTIAIVVGSMYWVLKDIDFIVFWNNIKSANYWWVISTIPVIIISHWIRAVRWKTMLKPFYKANSTWNLFSAVMIGYAANAVLPRGGEFLRPYVYARREKISFSTTFATILVERFIDVITLLMLFGGVFFFFRDALIKTLPELHFEKLILPVVTIVIILLLSFYPPVFRFFIRLLIKPFSERFYEKVNEIFNKFLKGFAVIKKPSEYARLIIESMGIWLFYTIPLYIMFYSFNFHIGYSLNFDDAVLLIVVSGIGSTIAPTPGAAGVYHTLITFTLVNLYGINKELALAYATVTHLVNYLVQLLLGGAFVLREKVWKIPPKSEIPEGNSDKNGLALED